MWFKQKVIEHSSPSMVVCQYPEDQGPVKIFYLTRWRIQVGGDILYNIVIDVYGNTASKDQLRLSKLNSDFSN